MTGAAVRCSGLVHVYRASGIDVAALRGIDLTVTPGERIALFGPSGSGKSTLLAVLAGIRRPSAGEVWIDDADIARASAAGLRRHRRATSGVVLQDAAGNLLTYASAIENVRYVQRGASSPLDPDRLLDAVGLDRRARSRPVSELARADQRAAAMATALANSPRLLLADEPTRELPPRESRRTVERLLQVTQDLGATVVVVTHDPDVAAAMDRTLLLRDGRIGAERHQADRDRVVVVIGADGSVQLPDAMLPRWRPGTRLEVRETDPQTLVISRADDDGDPP